MLLSLTNLEAGYGKKKILNSISMDIEAGQVVALLGHNGAGKSTTLKSIIGELRTTAGNIALNGQSLDRMGITERVKNGVRMLPEGRGVFADLTVSANIDVVAAANCTAGKSLFTREDVLRIFPVLAERLDSRSGDLSGGQQQMLAFSLAILGNPALLLLDEPSVGLAPNLVERLLQQVRTVCKEKQVGAILVEQNVGAALEVSDYVIVLNAGNIVFRGTPEDARKTDFWEYF
jgi:branched-chain amino acid transport system ATP-binding protein